MKNKYVIALIVVVALVVVFLVLKKKEGQKKDLRNTIVIGISQEPDSFDPLFKEMMASEEMVGTILRYVLTTRNEKWELLPELAEKIPSLKNGDLKLLPDGKMQSIWRLKKNLKWADGTPLTAEDFIFTHQVIMDNRIPVVSRDVDRRIEKMEALDPYTLSITWKKTYAYADLGGHQVVPKHLMEPIYKEDPKKYHESFYNASPVGNGPYKLTKWVSGSHLVFERNPLFYGEGAKFDKVIYKIIPNTNALEANLVSGEVDALSLGMTFDQAIDFEKRYGDKYNVYFTPGLVWEHIDLNLDNSILADKKVRQALLYALDREDLVNKLFEGKQTVSHSWLPPKHYGYNPDLKKYRYDPEKAKLLLSQAGWVVGKDGIRINNKGQKLYFEFMTTAGDKVREQVQQILQFYWKKVGIEVEIKNQPAKVYFGDTINYRKFKHLAMYAWVSGPASDGETSWTSDNIPSKENNWQGQNSPGWRNKESDKICHEVPNILDEKKRVELLRRHQEIWVEELPALPLYNRSEVTITRKDLANWKPTGTSIPITWNCEAWHLAK